MHKPDYSRMSDPTQQIGDFRFSPLRLPLFRHRPASLPQNWAQRWQFVQVWPFIIVPQLPPLIRHQMRQAATKPTGPFKRATLLEVPGLEIPTEASSVRPLDASPASPLLVCRGFHLARGHFVSQRDRGNFPTHGSVVWATQTPSPSPTQRQKQRGDSALMGNEEGILGP